MSDYHEYMMEREQLDFFVERGYQIEEVYENLNGAYLQLRLNNQVETFHVKTADGRKYFSSLLQQQMNKVI